jgi:beta-lactamase class A
MVTSKFSISMRHYVVAVLLVIIIAPGQAATDRCSDLQRRVETLLMPPLEASISIALIDLQSHCSAAVNGDRPVPMMSVYKLPIVLTALAATDKGLDLGRSMRVTRADIVSGHSPLADELRRMGSRNRTLRELASEAMLHSDNTSSDVLLAQLGGPAEVRKFLLAKGHGGISVDRFERDIERDYGTARFHDAIAERRDSASANSLAKLIADLYAGRLMSARASAEAIDLMQQVATGSRRLRAGLAPQWRLAHKTGTGELPSGFNIATNDAGMIEGPHGERMIAVVLIGPGHANFAQREALIADVARQAITWLSAGTAD